MISNKEQINELHSCASWEHYKIIHNMAKNLKEVLSALGLSECYPLLLESENPSIFALIERASIIDPDLKAGKLLGAIDSGMNRMRLLKKNPEAIKELSILKVRLCEERVAQTEPLNQPLDPLPPPSDDPLDAKEPSEGGDEEPRLTPETEGEEEPEKLDKKGSDTATVWGAGISHPNSVARTQNTADDRQGVEEEEALTLFQIGDIQAATAAVDMALMAELNDALPKNDGTERMKIRLALNFKNRMALNEKKKDLEADFDPSEDEFQEEAEEAPCTSVKKTSGRRIQIDPEMIEKMRREQMEKVHKKQEQAKKDAELLETLRREEERLEHQERAQKECLQEELQEVARLEAERAEKDLCEQQRLDQIRQDEQALQLVQKEEAEMAEFAQLEVQRIELERLEQLQLEKERIEAERVEALKKEAEMKEALRLAQERQEKERQEAAARIEREQKAEEERIEKERQAELLRMEERRAEEQREALRAEAERQEAERQEAERIEQEKKDAERREAERQEALRLEAERVEFEHQEALRLEAERMEFEHQEALRQEEERRAEIQRAIDKKEEERLAAIQRELDLKEAERQEALRAEREHQARIKREEERREQLRVEMERREEEERRLAAQREEQIKRCIPLMPLLLNALALKEDGHVRQLLQDNKGLADLDVSGKVPLCIAADVGYDKGMELLVENGATLNRMDTKGMSALSYAAQKGRVATCDLLVHWGADIHEQDGSGKTALHHAAIGGQFLLVKRLVEKYGVDPNLVDHNGKTALDLGKAKLKVVQFLKAITNKT